VQIVDSKTRECNSINIGGEMPYKFKVLSIDGGGIRGIIPAKILAEIEKRTGKRIFQLFDLIAGTSTGGILALGLAKPDPRKPEEADFTAEALIQLYRENGSKIFYEPTLERFTDADDLVRPKYSSDGRDAVLSQYFGDTPLLKSLTEVFLTSYDIELRVPVFFTSKSSKQETNSLVFRKICTGFSMKQAGMATSAAPTFFEPYQIPTAHRTDRGCYSLVDGGVFANNPTTLALMEAIIDSKKAGKPLRLDEILVVSLGTGSLTRKYPYDEARHWGLVGWVQPLLNITLDGSSESVAVQLEQLLPKAENEPPQYYRFQEFLNSTNDSMDNSSKDNIKNLELLADQIIAERTDDLDEMCQQLLATPSAENMGTQI
jgi:patatin-like phospholipase/acyl hydrolase